jgi:hypothetical protein
MHLKKILTLSLKEVAFTKNRFNSYIGNIAEMIAEETLLKQGFAVWGLKPYHAGIKVERGMFDTLYQCLDSASTRNHCKESRELAETQLREFFGEKFDDFWNYMNSIGVFGKEGIVGAVRISPKICYEHVYSPDLVVKKGNEIYIVEVKANTGNLKPKSKRIQGLLSARKFGLIPLVVHLNIDISASDFSIHELGVRQKIKS